MTVGYWCPVLHAHLPYVRHPEHPEFLEEDWFFEALTETYMPIVGVLDGLLADGDSTREQQGVLGVAPPGVGAEHHGVPTGRLQGRPDLVDVDQPWTSHDGLHRR